MEVKKEHVDKVIDLAKLSLLFAKTNRFVFHEDGKRYESDTDHTFMLSLIACSLADSFYKDKLDIGLVSQFALIHDLVEAYAKDTDTFINSGEEEQKLKRDRETAALNRLQDEFGKEFPWASKMIEEYDSQNLKEARFVKLVDKFMPDITDYFNGFAYIRSTNVDREKFYSFYQEKLEKWRAKSGEEFPEIIKIYEDITDRRCDLYEKIMK